MKAGLVASIHAMDALRASGVRLAGDVILASVQGEEDGGLGTFALLQRGWRADACVVAEPTELDVIPANSGSLTFRLRVPRPGNPRRPPHRGRQCDREVLAGVAGAGRARAAPPRSRRSADVTLAARPSAVDRHGDGRRLGVVGPGPAGRRGTVGVALGEPVEHARADLEQTVAELNDRDPWLADIPSSSSGGAGSSRPDGCRPTAT